MDQKLLDKVRKVAALTDSPNEHEAAAAAEKLQALLAGYNLSLSDLSVSEAVHQVIRDNDFVTYFAGWVKPVLNAAAKLYFCYYYYESFPTSFVKGHGLDKQARKLYVGSNSRTYLRHNFIGEEHNVVVAKYMGEYLISAMENLCRAATKPVPPDEKSSFRYSFMNACASQLCYRLMKRLEDSSKSGIKEGSTNLPALLSMYEQANKNNQEFLEAEKVTVKQKKSLVQIKNEAGAAAGLKAGKDIGLDQQLDDAANNNSKRIA